MTYTFDVANLLSVTDHAQALDIVVLSLSLSAGIYTLVTDVPFPAEQVPHLGLTEVP